MHYSEFPHAHYVKDGVGPGAVFLGDQERWNWRYLIKGLEINDFYDKALLKHFDESQYEAVQDTPEMAIEFIIECLPDRLTDDVLMRATEAQRRLFPPKVLFRDANVIYPNFGQKLAGY
jgi:hypothetical protein